MYTKQNFIDSFVNDIRIINHLATKITPEMASYRPTEGQRSMLELLRYISCIGVAGVDMILSNDTGKFGGYGEKSLSVTVENFQDAMKEQEQMMLDLMNKFTDEDLATVINLYNMGEKTKGVYLVETIGKWLPTYRMQLFLYLKSSGLSHIGTSNMWGGMDMPPAK